MAKKFFHNDMDTYLTGRRQKKYDVGIHVKRERTATEPFLARVKRYHRSIKKKFHGAIHFFLPAEKEMDLRSVNSLTVIKSKESPARTFINSVKKKFRKEKVEVPQKKEEDASVDPSLIEETIKKHSL
ncbi:MAG: hypothetical protein ACI8Y7_000602 [Candidatus Woesearchaeota archaeon]|jgi:hypothetical protein